MAVSIEESKRLNDEVDQTLAIYASLPKELRDQLSIFLIPRDAFSNIVEILKDADELLVIAYISALKDLIFSLEKSKKEEKKEEKNE